MPGKKYGETKWDDHVKNEDVLHRDKNERNSKGERVKFTL
jgi:hypothetical protein